MKLQDSEHVKWIGDDGGWCMGHVQTTPRGEYVTDTAGVWPAKEKGDRLLVKHTLTGALEFVASDILQRHPHRSEWSEHAEPGVA